MRRNIWKSSCWRRTASHDGCAKRDAAMRPGTSLASHARGEAQVANAGDLLAGRHLALQRHRGIRCRSLVSQPVSATCRSWRPRQPAAPRRDGATLCAPSVARVGGGATISRQTWSHLASAFDSLPKPSQERTDKGSSFGIVPPPKEGSCSMFGRRPRWTNRCLRPPT